MASTVYFLALEDRVPLLEELVSHGFCFLPATVLQVPNRPITSAVAMETHISTAELYPHYHIALAEQGLNAICYKEQKTEDGVDYFHAEVEAGGHSIGFVPSILRALSDVEILEPGIVYTRPAQSEVESKTNEDCEAAYQLIRKHIKKGGIPAVCHSGLVHPVLASQGTAKLVQGGTVLQCGRQYVFDLEPVAKMHRKGASIDFDRFGSWFIRVR